MLLFVIDLRLIFDFVISFISSICDIGFVNCFLFFVNFLENKLNVIINGNSNIVGFNVDMNRFIWNNEV